MSESETKVCQNCEARFTVEPEDFLFYEKINVLPPKMCPLCRAQRRLSFRNERVFYKRPCDKCKKDVISMYSPNKPYTVWCYDCWFSDDWDASSYAREYDPSRSFLDQFEELWKAIPKVALIYVRSVNSEYINISAENKDCYMIVESSNNEGCIHCYWVQQCKDCVDTSFSHQTQLSYESDDCYGCYKLLYSKGCHDCRESYFLLDCRNCVNCIGCVNLRNTQYHIFNTRVSKEEYESFLKDARLDTHAGVEALRKRFVSFAAAQPRKFAETVNAIHSTGNYIKNAKNCRSCFHCYDAEDCTYGVHVWRDAKDCFDVDTSGIGAELIYNSMNTGLNVSHYIGSSLCWTCSFMEYCYYCFDSNHCFGSAGLRKKNHHILNKPYDKASFEALRGTIIADMRKRGEWGEFFPAYFSAFGYNESAAQEQIPLAKAEALRQGFKWEDFPHGTYGKETVSWHDMPDSIRGARREAILGAVFACAGCKKNYRVIPAELLFYERLEAPLPRLCPDCRHRRRFSARGPNRVWRRACNCGGSEVRSMNNEVRYRNVASHFHGTAPCPNEFETSYAPDRPEIVYCEQCYNAEAA